MSGYGLHPEAYKDIDEIREYIAGDNLDAADRVITEIFNGIRTFSPLPLSGLPASQSHVASPSTQACVLCANM